MKSNFYILRLLFFNFLFPILLLLSSGSLLGIDFISGYLFGDLFLRERKLFYLLWIVLVPFFLFNSYFMPILWYLSAYALWFFSSQIVDFPKYTRMLIVILLLCVAKSFLKLEFSDILNVFFTIISIYIRYYFSNTEKNLGLKVTSTY